MNLTSAFVDISKTTAGLWTSRLMEEEQHDLKEKKRAPFLPFVLRNRTGEISRSHHTALAAVRRRICMRTEAVVRRYSQY